MLHMQLLADEMNRQRLVEAESRAPQPLAARRHAARRARRIQHYAAQAVRKAFQLRA